MPVIRAENLSKTYHAAKGKTVEAVKSASLSLEAGEILGLLGPNGAGKTTLLRMLGTIISPTSGTCWIDGVPSADDPSAARQRIGFLSGNTKLYGRLKGWEVLRYFGRLYRMEDSVIRTRTDELSSMLNMDAYLNRRCDTLSTGQLQKVNIARVILHDPSILILDEPTLGLDIMSSQTILHFIRDAKSRGHSIIFSTHYMTEAEFLCDRVALIHQGSLFATGTQEELIQTTSADNLQDAFLELVSDGEPDSL